MEKTQRKRPCSAVQNMQLNYLQLRLEREYFARLQLAPSPLPHYAVLNVAFCCYVLCCCLCFSYVDRVTQRLSFFKKQNTSEENVSVLDVISYKIYKEYYGRGTLMHLMDHGRFSYH